jgi:serine protease Do
MDLRLILPRTLLLTATIALTACASGYSQFYKAAPGATPEAIAATRVAPPTGQPIVERSASPGPDASALFDAYTKRGYSYIGGASFNSASQDSEESAVEQGRKVGADLVVIFNPRYTGSTTTAMPLTVPTTTTSHSSGSATAYGPGGTVTAYGTGTTTTYGTSTTLIPITVHRSDYGAAYFVKRKWAFGVRARDLNDAERQELQTNKGAFILVVVDNTPAYAADLLRGDIILAVNGNLVLNQESLTNLLRERSGQKVTISLYRRGQRLEKTVQL